MKRTTERSKMERGRESMDGSNQRRTRETCTRDACDEGQRDVNVCKTRNRGAQARGACDVGKRGAKNTPGNAWMTRAVVERGNKRSAPEKCKRQ